MTNKMQSALNTISILTVLALFAILLGVSIQFVHPPLDTAKNYCLENGPAETGAINLVSAIYLEYRAFDTLGETVVLLLSIMGILFFLKQRHA